MCVCMYVCMYVYSYVVYNNIKRKSAQQCGILTSQRQPMRSRCKPKLRVLTKDLSAKYFNSVYICIYIYIYIYIYMYL